MQAEEGAWFPRLEAARAALEAGGWLVHGQATFVEQARPGFTSPYRGDNSLRPRAQQRNTFSADLILGRRLWTGAEVIFSPQVVRGFGLSGTYGVAAFPNGEAFRIGSVTPSIFVPRVFFRQTIALSEDTVPGEPDQLRFAGPLPRERITLTVGKFSVFDIFDRNRYAHDPRTQFLNWAFVAAAAVDWANDAKGFTHGVALEWEDGRWGVRLGAFQVAREVNSLNLDPRPGRGQQLLAQLDHAHEIAGRPGILRFILGHSRTRSQRYSELLAGDITDTDRNPRGSYRNKGMAAITLEQQITDTLGVFARLSWNDGRSQQWMYTQMDRAASVGLSLNGAGWGREGDTLGAAVNIGGLSRGHRRFLAAGGLGFIIGDGRLSYAPEVAGELYYDARLAPGLNMGAHAQLIVNPAYNADRGPVAVFGLRARVAF